MILYTYWKCIFRMLLKIHAPLLNPIVSGLLHRLTPIWLQEIDLVTKWSLLKVNLYNYICFTCGNYRNEGSSVNVLLLFKF